MKNRLTKIIIGIVLVLGITSVALGAPFSRLERTLLPEVSSRYFLGTSTPASFWSGIFTGTASTSRITAITHLKVGGAGATSTIDSNGATSTIAGGLVADIFHASSTSATSTANNGINLYDGCFAIDGTCVTGGGGGSGTINSGTTNRYAYYSGATTLDSANYLTTDITNQRLGVATATPFATLSVAGTLNAIPFAVSTSTASATSTAFIIDASGDVGIGTAAPRGALEVYNNVSADFGSTFSLNSGSLSTNFDTDYETFVMMNDNTTNNNYATFGFGTKDTGGTRRQGAQIIGFFPDHTEGSVDAGLAFRTRNNGSQEEAMRIDTNGRIGIGTTSPYAKLSVVGEVVGANFTATSTTATSTLSTGGLAVGTSQFVVQQSSGNVGIGTASPGGVLDVRQNSSSEVLSRVWNTGTGPAAFRFVAADGQEGKFQITNSSYWVSAMAGSYVSSDQNNNYLAFRVRGASDANTEAALDAATRMTILGSGNVGIGTTTPGTPLSVQGDSVLGGSVTMRQFNATSTTATSTIQGFLDVLGTGTNATSTYSGNLHVKGALKIGTASVFLDDNGLTLSGGGITVTSGATTTGNNGFNLTSGCFSISGTCIGGGGSGTINSGTTNEMAYYSGATAISSTALLVVDTTNKQITVAPTGRTSGTPKIFVVTGPTDSGFTASTEVVDVDFNLGRTVTWSSGNITNQRAMRVLAPTYGFSGGSATISNAATFYIDAAPAEGSFATIVNPYSLWVDAGTARFDGKMIIGTSTPYAQLSVRGGGTGSLKSFEVADNASTTRFVILDNGIVGIGTTTPFANFSINGNSVQSAPVFAVATSSGSATSTAVVIDSNGRMGIGTTSPSTTLGVAGGVTFSSLSAGAAGDNAVCINPTTKEIKDAGGSACVASSLRYKQDVKTFTNALSTIQKLNPVTFSYKEQYDHAKIKGTRSYGLIAEEVEKVDKKLVGYEADGKTPKTVHYEQLISVVIEAIQEQQKQIDELKKENEDLRKLLKTGLGGINKALGGLRK